MKHMLLKNPKGQQRNLKIPWNKWQWKHTIIQTLWDAAKAVIRGKFIVISAFLKKQEKSQINNQTYHLKELGKDQGYCTNFTETRRNRAAVKQWEQRTIQMIPSLRQTDSEFFDFTMGQEHYALGRNCTLIFSWTSDMWDNTLLWCWAMSHNYSGMRGPPQHSTIQSTQVVASSAHAGERMMWRVSAK